MVEPIVGMHHVLFLEKHLIIPRLGLNLAAAIEDAATKAGSDCVPYWQKTHSGTRSLIII